MAKGAEKKAEQRRAAELKMNGIIVAVVSAIYWSVRLLFQEAPSTLWQWAGVAMLYSLYFMAVRSIADAAAAAHVASVGTAGSVWRDLLYITAIVQLGSLWTNYAWQLLWLIPAYAAYSAFSMIKGMIPSTPDAPPPPDPTTKAGRREARKQAKKNGPKVRHVRR